MNKYVLRFLIAGSLLALASSVSAKDCLISWDKKVSIDNNCSALILPKKEVRVSSRAVFNVQCILKDVQKDSVVLGQIISANPDIQPISPTYVIRTSLPAYGGSLFSERVGSYSFKAKIADIQFNNTDIAAIHCSLVTDSENH